MSNKVPIFDPDRGFRTWLVSEIYDGTDDGGVYVPNTNDGVIDWETGLYRVVHVDIDSGLSQMVRHTFPIYNPNVSEDDILMGIAPGRPSEAYRLYVNGNTDPITAAVDSRLHIYGSENISIRLFEGTDVSASGKVLSLYYDDNGQLTDDKYPLELVSTIHEDNIAIKVPVHGYVTHALHDGELVTAVVYNSSGIVTSINPLLATATSYVRPPSKETKFIIGIELKSPFLSDGDSTILEVPIQTPIDSLNLMGLVKYSDGSDRLLPIDGTKFTISGLEVFTISLAGQTIPLVLTYNLSEEEASYASNSYDGNNISRVYYLTTTSPEHAYSVKLFVTPMWDTHYNHWRLEYYLYNLLRNSALVVTDLVMTGVVDGKTYDPEAYGITQRLTIAIDMNDVSDDYVAFRHVQTYEISLISPIEDSIPSWTLRYNPGTGEIYGQDVVIRATAKETDIEMVISSDAPTMEEWLELMYNSVYPLFDTSIETRAPDPTHLEIRYGDASTEVEVHEFNQVIPFPAIPAEGDTMTLRWFIKTEATVLELATTPATITYKG